MAMFALGDVIQPASPLIVAGSLKGVSDYYRNQNELTSNSSVSDDNTNGKTNSGMGAPEGDNSKPTYNNESSLGNSSNNPYENTNPNSTMAPIEAAQKIVQANRTYSALDKVDKHHRSASFLTVDQLSNGQTFSIQGYDKITKTLLQVYGELDGVPGIYEYILTPDGLVSHQRFIPNGRITGYENQK